MLEFRLIHSPFSSQLNKVCIAFMNVSSPVKKKTNVIKYNILYYIHSFSSRIAINLENLAHITSLLYGGA